ncbi:uncharacterized protein LOC109603596 [Aethina tumida]|uniref:uncharacterized protein LOC109603596 n=1 Tax=Aethina tumida TaxID=116153 RepID=UPI00096ADEE3|nr:uncharacterized protein LOC109603596 [Aethina tumida]
MDPQTTDTQPKTKQKPDYDDSVDIKKMKQGMSYSKKEKTIILNVFKYFRAEYSDKCVTEIVRRTSRATGCSEKSIFMFRKEEKTGFKEPSKTKIRKNININSRFIKYDETVRQSIRKIIYDLKYKNIVPSLNTILKSVNGDESLPDFSLMTLRRLLFDMGFYYEKDGRKSILMENNPQQAKPTECLINNEQSKPDSQLPQPNHMLNHIPQLPVQHDIHNPHMRMPNQIIQYQNVQNMDIRPSYHIMQQGIYS